MAHFKDSIPKEWLLYKNRLTRCLDGHGVMARPAKFSLTRRLLLGRALANFNNAASLRTTETREHYLQCIHVVTLGVSPQYALKEQKTWMRCFLKKLQDMCIKEYVDRVVKINDYLLQFPPSVPAGNSKKLPNNKLLELLEFGIPLKWRN